MCIVHGFCFDKKSAVWLGGGRGCGDSSSRFENLNFPGSDPMAKALPRILTIPAAHALWPMFWKPKIRFKESKTPEGDGVLDVRLT